MKLSDFRIGAAFYTAANDFVCTDIGSRVVVAVHADELAEYPSGPPYSILESVFDAHDLPACYATAAERDADRAAVETITKQVLLRRKDPAKLWLDDIRTPPDGWTWVKTASDAIAALERGNVVEISLDHDLGDDVAYGTGYDVVCWIEEAVVTRYFLPPNMAVHSANCVGVARMNQGIEQIAKAIRLHAERE
jgi:hypothetical protein